MSTEVSENDKQDALQRLDKFIKASMNPVETAIYLMNRCSYIRRNEQTVSDLAIYQCDLMGSSAFGTVWAADALQVMAPGSNVVANTVTRELASRTYSLHLVCDYETARTWFVANIEHVIVDLHLSKKPKISLTLSAFRVLGKIRISFNAEALIQLLKLTPLVNEHYTVYAKVEDTNALERTELSFVLAEPHPAITINKKF